MTRYLSQTTVPYLRTAVTMLLVASLSQPTTSGETQQAPLGPPDPAPTFSDVTGATGVDFQHHHGGTGNKQLAETMGSGVAWLDFDRDGRWDLYFVDSDGANALYRGSDDAIEAAPQANIADPSYGMGVSVSDYDGDGFSDVYITNLGRNALYRNNGDGTFSGVTEEAGVGDPEWSVSSAWGDLNGDGLPDLYVANYIVSNPENPLYCGEPDKGIRSYCHISLFDGVSDTIYRNDGDGRFTNVSREAGFTEDGKGLGVAMGHVDDDNWLDVYVANDTTRNFLLLNRGGFMFEDVGLASGVGYGASGQPQAGMGTELADLDGDGRPEILVTNFAFEPVNLYRSVAPGFFLDDTFQLGLGEATFPTLGFGLAVEDFDGDGDLDIAVANGHILDDVSRMKDNVTFPQPNQVLVNRLTELNLKYPAGTWRPDRNLLTETTLAAGEAISRLRVSRGMAAGDFNGDGRPDLAVVNSNGPAELLRNDTLDTANRLVLRLTGRKSDRDAVGTRLFVQPLDSEARWAREVRSASSYASQHASDVYFGLGLSPAARVEIIWPGGDEETLGQLEAGRLYVLAEGRGVIADRALTVRETTNR